MGANTYSYDCNGNQTTRYVNGQTFTLSYDAENRLVGVTGPSLTASFVYDGDGNRVKSTINGVTTSFVGNWYEVTGSTVTKYYYAGSQRVAMRTGSTLYYLLGDHLGSTSITTSSSGGLVSELRYKPWGETRYSSGTTPTQYQYTGQLNETSLGLYFFNARWMDVTTGRFTSPDSIIPEQSQGVQAWDRYAYTNNDPLRFTDPTGHRNCEEDGYNCPGDKVYGPPSTVYVTFHVTFQVYPKLPNGADTTYSANESYTDYSTGGNPEMVPSLPWAPGQPNVPINDNQTTANNASNALGLLDQGAMGLLAGSYMSSPKYAQDVAIRYSITFDNDFPAPIKNITGMDITNSTQADLMNYTVDITNLNGLSPSDSMVSAAPGETVAVPLPANVNGPNYLRGIHITIIANNACLGTCWQSQNPGGVAGAIDFSFSPYNIP